MNKQIRFILTTLLVALLLLNGLFYLRQPQIVFYPSRTLEATPKTWGMLYEDVILKTEDGVRLHGWYLPHADSQRVLLFFHGNGGNISHRYDSLQIFHQLGLNVLIIDYRGYGLSEGTPSEEGVYRDARAAWRYLLNERGFKAEQIVLFGRSLGGAVAAHLAAEVNPAALILESTFASSRDMASVMFPLLSKFIYVRYDFDTVARLSERTSPLLMLHSPQDEVIPFASGRRAFDSALAPKRFVELQGDHNSGFLVSQPRYQEQLKAFLAQLPN